MSENAPIQFKLMLPGDLKIRVEEMASLNRRSLSQEIVAALEGKYPTPSAAEASGIEARVLLWLARRIRKGPPKPGSLRLVLNPTLRQPLRPNPRKNFESKVEAV
jgi:hypothetical protein